MNITEAQKKKKGTIFKVVSNTGNNYPEVYFNKENKLINSESDNPLCINYFIDCDFIENKSHVGFMEAIECDVVKVDVSDLTDSIIAKKLNKFMTIERLFYYMSILFTSTEISLFIREGKWYTKEGKK